MNQAADQRLVEAVQTGDGVAVARALAEGADPNAAVGRFRGSVLIEAARSGRLEVVRLLVDAGASVGPVGQFAVTPLRVAILEACTEVVQYLIAHEALPAEPATRTSVLTEAVSYTRHRPRPTAFATLQVLLRAGATPHPGEEALLITAVMRAAAPAVLRLLLANGADVNQQRSDGTPAIVIAARRGDHAAVDALLQAGADPDSSDQHGRTALMHAVERSEQRVITALLVAGAAIDTISADEMTALQLARGWQRQNIQFMLGEHHAGLDDVPITRTVVRIIRADAQLTGDPPMLHLLANVIDIVLQDLGDDEWTTRTGTDADTARTVALRLHNEIVPAASASWFQLDITADELAAIRSALVELAYGTTRVLPAGTRTVDIVDLLEEINLQLGR